MSGLNPLDAGCTLPRDSRKCLQTLFDVFRGGGSERQDLSWLRPQLEGASEAPGLGGACPRGASAQEVHAAIRPVRGGSAE